MHPYLKAGLWIGGGFVATALLIKILAVIAVMQGIALTRQIVELVKMIMQ